MKENTLASSVWWLGVLSLAQQAAASCGQHHVTQSKWGYSPQGLESHKVGLDAVAVEGIRIVPHYTDLGGLTGEQQTVLKNEIMPAALGWFEDAVMVEPVQGNLKLTPLCTTVSSSGKCLALSDQCGCEATGSGTCTTLSDIPTSHYTDDTSLLEYYPNGSNSPASTWTGGGANGGIPDADFVLYISARNTPTCTDTNSNVLAYASTCRRAENGRPLAGYMQVCGWGNLATDLDFVRLVNTVTHELTHALVFSTDSMVLFKDSTGQPLCTEQEIATGVMSPDQVQCANILTITSDNEHAASGTLGKRYIKTPTVLQKVREHFGCSTLPGAELENQGGAGHAMSHWEQRSLNDEIMTASLTPYDVFSEITLALFEDSGWYKVNWDVVSADVFRFGREKGCGFAQDRCIPNGASSPIFGDHFCSMQGAIGCTVDRQTRASCTMAAYSADLPPNYQYFDNPRTGSTVRYSDYCPMWNLDAKPCSDKLATVLWNSETFGYSSVCFLANVQGEGRGTCHKHTCVKVQNEWSMHISVGQHTVVCTQQMAGTKAPIPGGSNTITCPTDIVARCELGEECPSGCNNHGSCVNGACVCQPGYFGADCYLANTANNHIADVPAMEVLDVQSGGVKLTLHLKGSITHLWVNPLNTNSNTQITTTEVMAGGKANTLGDRCFAEVGDGQTVLPSRVTVDIKCNMAHGQSVPYIMVAVFDAVIGSPVSSSNSCDINRCFNEFSQSTLFSFNSVVPTAEPTTAATGDTGVPTTGPTPESTPGNIADDLLSKCDACNNAAQSISDATGLPVWAIVVIAASVAFLLIFGVVYCCCCSSEPPKRYNGRA